MKLTRKVNWLGLLLALLLVSCSSSPDPETPPQNTAAAPTETVTAIATPTPTPTSTAVPTETPGAEPDKPVSIWEACEPEGVFEECVEAHSFTGSVLVAKDWDVLFEGGFGLADVETGRANTVDTVFRVFSISKQFTATLILLLQEDGLLSVDDTLDQYFPDFPNGESITIHHLLNHSSGIANYTEIEDAHTRIFDPNLSVDDTLSMFWDEELDFTPGNQFSYSNSGYVLLGLITEIVSGHSYEDLLGERIFEPLNMHASGYGDDEFREPNSAFGYSDDAGQRKYLNHDVPYASGGLVSTARDLFTWDQAMFNGQVLESDSFDQMFRQYEARYGYGWQVGRLGGFRVGHSGRIMEFGVTEKSYWVDDGIVIIILSNHDSPEVIPLLMHSLYSMVLTDQG